LAGGIAHDFNNILTAIYGYIQLATLKVGEKEIAVKNLEKANRATDRARQLVNQILTFSRQTEFEKSPVQISHIVKEALKLLRSSIPTTIEFKEDIASRRSILADPTQIHQIIMNLVTNAYHAMMKTGGTLGVSLQEVTVSESDMIAELEVVNPGKYIRLEVSDTGYGMDEATREKIFEPYFTTKEPGRGTGLGLAVVHGIVTNHQGFINVYSEPGQGTTIHVYLPMLEYEPEKAASAENEKPVGYGDERILFVDDEETIVNLANELLTFYGYKITIFQDGLQALEDFEKHPDDYDLIVTDMSMPNMNGLQLAQRVKEIRPEIPVVLCSGFSAIINKEEALEKGVTRYLQKPLAMDNVAKVIRELLDKNRKEQAPAS
ncbi:MAG: response regulator, partial [Desulfobulbaceae bacterium]|nr:response regulator [Desulfobulbaceae bacterium]